MQDLLDIQFMPLSAAPAGAVLLLAGQELALGPAARSLHGGAEEETPRGLRKLVVQCAKPDLAGKACASRKAVAEGVFLARDLVNEPANMLGPVEFAERMRDLSRSGLEVEVFDEDQLQGLKMGALLAVGQGSERPSRMVVMQWHGAKSKRAKTLCFVGKGVCF